ncbi:DALR anticodon-binding domain-containing protein [Paenibacillus daejeonensis]
MGDNKLSTIHLIQEARLRLVRATARTLKTGLYLIGLQAPESI